MALKQSTDLLSLESGIYQFWLHSDSQTSRVSASLAIGPCDAVHLHVSTNAMPLNACMVASTHLAKVVPPDADITPGDASSEESPAGIAAHCPIMLRDSILVTTVCGDYALALLYKLAKAQ